MGINTASTSSTSHAANATDAWSEVVEFHVLPYGERWALSRDGRRVATFDTKQQTIEEACDRAQAEELSSIVVHDAHGHVQRSHKHQD